MRMGMGAAAYVPVIGTPGSGAPGTSPEGGADGRRCSGARPEPPAAPTTDFGQERERHSLVGMWQ